MGYSSLYALPAFTLHHRVLRNRFVLREMLRKRPRPGRQAGNVGRGRDSPTSTVMSDDGEKTARRIAQQFESSTTNTST